MLWKHRIQAIKTTELFFKISLHYVLYKKKIQTKKALITRLQAQKIARNWRKKENKFISKCTNETIFFLCRTVPHATRNNKPRLTASDQKFKILFNKNTENENRNEQIKEKTEVCYVILSLLPSLITTKCSVWLVLTNTIARSACICMFCMYSVCEWHTIAESRIEIYSNVFVMVCVSRTSNRFLH